MVNFLNKSLSIEILKFGDIEIAKNKFYLHKSLLDRYSESISI